MYIFDTSAFIVLKHYYRNSFPSLWTGLEELIDEKVLVSTREVYNELQNYNDADYIQTWANDHKEIFETPTNDELEFVAGVFQIEHFRAD